ncbi:MAG: heme-binding protein [Betaproteobacteria bacterium]|nr:heme-binding protein [Betaproteobacteria bacterium]
MYIKPALSLSDAKAIANAAHAKAEENNWNVVIAIVDEGGHLMLLERMDYTQLGSIEVAQEKARTAYLFRRPTKKLEESILGGRTIMLNLPQATPIEGGVPLMNKGEMIGAIGVSGVQSFQDGIIAEAGAALAADFNKT